MQFPFSIANNISSFDEGILIIDVFTATKNQLKHLEDHMQCISWPQNNKYSILHMIRGNLLSIFDIFCFRSVILLVQYKPLRERGPGAARRYISPCFYQYTFVRHGCLNY